MLLFFTKGDNMSEINGNTKLLGVIGNPIKHTLSPVIHNKLCKYTGINAVYVPICVESDIATAVKGLFAAGFTGLNITVPYKEEVIRSLAEMDDLAKSIGAVNTLVRTDKGYKGYNTDMSGLSRALDVKGIDISGKKAVVIGAGGAARAVCIDLVHNGATEIYLLNRTLDKAEAIAKEIPIVKPLSLSDYKQVPEDRYIMFQCTSVGLGPDDGLLIDDNDFYKMADYGYDLIYNPAVTPFIAKLNELGIKNDNGLTMLLYQGIIAFEKWFGIKITHEISEAVYTDLCRELYGNNIVLIGYMGTGKTSVGKLLAKERGMDFIDLDAYIEEKEGRTISDIFDFESEEYFRNLETKVIHSLSSLSNTVIATGGGAVLRRENRNLLGKLGEVIFLKTDVDTLAERLKGDETRPLIKSETEDELRKRISKMLDIRNSYYDILADQIINTDRLTPSEIVEIIN